jgi:hypothetical protein
MLNPFDPMPTIQAILGMPVKVHMVQVVLDELDFVPECERNYHAAGEPHSGPAAFLQVAPCECATGLRCASGVARFMASARVGGSSCCSVCGLGSPDADLRFIPLDAS